MIREFIIKVLVIIGYILFPFVYLVVVISSWLVNIPGQTIKEFNELLIETWREDYEY